MGAIAALISNALGLTRSAQTSPKNIESSSAVVLTPFTGKAAISNAKLYRHWAKRNEWVKGAITIRRSQVSSADWDISPVDPTKPYSRRLQRQLRELFRNPNPARDSYRSFIEPVTEDLLTLDAGVIEKVRNLAGEVVELWPVNAEEIMVSTVWDGDPNETRYYWKPDGSTQVRATFTNDEMIYMMLHPRTDSVLGFPPMETLRLVIESEMAASEYNRRQVAGAAPDGIFDLGEGATETQVARYANYFLNQVASQGTLGFLGGTKGAKFINLRPPNRDMQFMEWQVYLVRKIAVVFGLSPQDLGVTFDVNRSTSEIQLQISEDRGLRPLMTSIQEYLTEEIVWDKGFGGMANNLAFRFTALNLRESTAKAAINETALARVPWRFVNEARMEEGREPIPELDGKLIMATPQGALDISDVPTVREFMEMQSRSKAPSSEGESLKTLIEFLTKRVEPVNVTVSAPPTPQLQAPTVVNVNTNGVPVDPKAPKIVGRRSEYETDPRGLITGKTEIEQLDDGTERSVRKVQFNWDEAGKRVLSKTEMEFTDAN